MLSDTEDFCIGGRFFGAGLGAGLLVCVSIVVICCFICSAPLCSLYSN